MKGLNVGHYRNVYVSYMSGFESHPRQLIFSRKNDCLECAVLLCLVCLLDLACFFLSFFSSLISNTGTTHDRSKCN